MYGLKPVPFKFTHCPEIATFAFLLDRAFKSNRGSPFDSPRDGEARSGQAFDSLRCATVAQDDTFFDANSER